MLNLFRKKTTGGLDEAAQSVTPYTNRVDELADSLQRSGRTQELERELERLDRSSLSASELESWWHLYGIAAFTAERNTEALERFQEAYRQFPDSAQIRFSLGQQYVRAGATEKGFELFGTCSFPEVSREYALAQARYAYLWGRYDDGFLFLRPFFEAYMRLRILDDHFLYVRGLPFFGQWWSYLAAFSILSGDLQELESVTQSVTKTCHDYDFDYLQLELKAFRDDRPEQLLDALEMRLANVSEATFPTGYTRMNIAAAKARAATTVGTAQELLAGVRLSEQDFPWLEDIRTLAVAEAAHRLGDTALERERAGVFLGRQPMLFEPDIALNFHLLRYQETLKPMVRMN